MHGIPADDVHFHEVGALDSIADVVGVCAALHDLGVDDGQRRRGRGRIRPGHESRTATSRYPCRRSPNWPAAGGSARGGPGELATPTGMALIATLAASGARTCRR